MSDQGRSSSAEDRDFIQTDTVHGACCMLHGAWRDVKDPRSRRGSEVDHPEPSGLGGPWRQGGLSMKTGLFSSVSVTSCTDERGRHHLVDRRIRPGRWDPRERFGARIHGP
jgi:hypothetical protein